MNELFTIRENMITLFDGKPFKGVALLATP